MFTGCAKSNPSPEDEALMHFVPTLPGTKATDSAFEAGDSFGIYAVEYAEGIPSPLQISGNWANNAKASFDGSRWTVTPPIWWKDGAIFRSEEHTSELQSPVPIPRLLLRRRNRRIA